jgi:hypothetical protein
MSGTHVIEKDIGKCTIYFCNIKEQGLPLYLLYVQTYSESIKNKSNTHI